MTWEELLKAMTPEQLAAQGFDPSGKALPPSQIQAPQATGQVQDPEQWYTDYSAGRTGKAFKAPPTMAILHDFASKSDPKNIDKYNWAFDEKGIYRLLPEGVQGAHARDFNTQLGIAHRGYEGEKLTPAAIQNAEKLLSRLEAQYPGLQYKTHYELGPRGTLTGGKSPKEGTWFQQVRPGGQAMDPQMLQMLLASQSGVGTTVPPSDPTQAALSPARAAMQARVPQTVAAGGEAGPTVPPQQTGQRQVQAEKGQGGWQKALGDPATRAFMISMGTQMMVGGWGNPLSQLGQAIGQGAAGAAATNKYEDELLTKTAELEGKDADRASREKVAEIGAGSRIDVANIRGQYSMQRAKMAGAKSVNDLAAYNSVYNATAKRLDAANILKKPDEQLSNQQIAEMAAAEADAQWQRHAGLKGAMGIAGEGNREKMPSPVSPGGGQGAARPAPTGENEGGEKPKPSTRRTAEQAMEDVGASIDTGQAAVSKFFGWGKPKTPVTPPEKGGAVPDKGAPQANAPPPVKGPPTWQEYTGVDAQGKENYPGVAAALRDPKARERLKKDRPDWKPMLDQLDRVYSTKPGAY